MADDANSRRAARVAAAWETKRRNARQHLLTARAPAWLRLGEDGGGFEPIPERAAIVRRIFEESAEGVGTNAIARRFNDEAIPPFGNSNGWQESYIKKILANVAVLGILQPHKCLDGKREPAGPPVPDYFPAVVEAELFEKAREAIRSRFVGVAGRKRKTWANLVSGLTVCSVCGGPMRHFDKGAPGRQWLQCDNARRHAGCDHVRKWPYGPLETALIAMLRGIEADPAAMPEISEIAALPEDERYEARRDLAALLHRKVEKLTFFPQEVASLVLAGGSDIRLLRLDMGRSRSDQTDLVIEVPSKNV